MDNERMEELEKIEAHGAENGWVAPMTEEDKEFFAYFRSVFKRLVRQVFQAYDFNIHLQIAHTFGEPFST